MGDRKPGRKRHLEIEAECGRSFGKEESIVVGCLEGRGAVGGGDTAFDRDRSLSSTRLSENGWLSQIEDSEPHAYQKSHMRTTAPNILVNWSQAGFEMET